MRPVIGITCNYDYKDTIGTVTNLGGPLQDWDYLAMDYVNAVARAGGIPVILPNTDDPEAGAQAVERLDGLILSGGSDVDPHLYGSEPIARCGAVFTRRDNEEAIYLKAAYARKIPLLGICRGVQFMNAAFGGTLYQDLPSEKGTAIHSSMVYSRNEAAHEVRLEPGSRLHDIYGKLRLGVNSYHHQAVKDLAPNAVVAGVSADGVIEALEFSGGHAFTLGVQWHPEMMYNVKDQQKLFKAFVTACCGR